MILLVKGLAGELIVTTECIVSDASRTREERTAIVRMIDELLPIYRKTEINREGLYNAADHTLGQDLYPDFAKI